MATGDRAAKNQGFTIIEIIVVVGLFTLTAGFAMFVSMDSYRGYVFRAEQNLAVSVLQKARSAAIANIGEQPHGVRVDLVGKQYVIFGAGNINVPFISSSIDHSGMSEVVFNQLNGNITTLPGALHLSDAAGHSSDITFDNEGQINY